MGIKKGQIFIDGRAAVHTGSQGRVDAWQLYQQGNTITPRLNISKVADAVSTASGVFFSGYPAISVGAHIGKSQGDADTQGGVLNGGLKGEATFFKTGSSQLLIEGHEAVRAFDLCEPNRGNGPLMPLIQKEGLPSEATLPEWQSIDRVAEEEEAAAGLVLQLSCVPPNNDYGQVALLQPSRQDGELGLLSGLVPMVAECTGGVSCQALRLSSSDRATTPVMPCLLEQETLPAYTAQDKQAWPILAKDWARYYPIPLSFEPLSARALNKPVGAEWGRYDSAVDLTCLPVYPVSEDRQPLPSGWLYLFMDGYLWRELKITTAAMGMPLYHFSEVNLLTQQGRAQRQASTQGRLDNVLVPIDAQGKPPALRVAFSQTQWPWARVVSAGGMHPADPRVLLHRQSSKKNHFLSNEKISLQSIVEYPVETLHTQADSPYAVYTGPLLLVSI